MLVGLALPAAARGQSDSDTASKILAMESVWNQAEEKGDARALSLIFDDAMIYVDEDGSVMTKTEFLAHAKESGGLQSLTTFIMSVHVYGDTAIVAGSYRAKGVDKGRPFQRNGRFMDIWARKKGNWVCVAAQATPVLH